MNYNFVRPDGQPCLAAEEFNLVRNMLIAVVEERYKDAGNQITLFSYLLILMLFTPFPLAYQQFM